jgi:hypothetical protein
MGLMTGQNLNPPMDDGGFLDDAGLLATHTGETQIWKQIENRVNFLLNCQTK